MPAAIGGLLLLAGVHLGLMHPLWAASEEAGVLIFISLSMPEPALRNLALEAGRVDAVLLLRGLHGGSMQATLERLQGLYGVQDRKTGETVAPLPSVWIDPLAFERFNVQAVPMFALLPTLPARCVDPPCTAPPHLRLGGEVSLRTALEHFQREPAGKARAAALLAILEGTGQHRQ